MYSKIILVLATACVVNAFVITDNIFDDDAEAEVKASPSRCNSKFCDWLCQRLKKTNGTCIESHCKCEKSLIAEDADDMTDPAELLSPGNCNLRACEQQCRRLGFPGGACVNGRCKCDNFFNPIDDAETEVKARPNRCNSKVCDWFCRRFKKTNGTCIESHCKCEKSLIAKDDAETEIKASPSKCNSKWCDWLCHRLKKTNGTCVEGRCKCEKSLIAEDAMNEFDYSVSLDDTLFSTEDEVSAESLPVSELSEDPTKPGCNPQACHQFCRRIKRSGGVCVNGRCKCDYFFSTDEDVVDEYSEFEMRRTCSIKKCNRKCTRRGYEGATCVEGRCKCYKNPEKSLPVSELSEDQSERSCNIQACNQLCRRLKFPGGVCVNGRCKCDHFFGSEDAYVVNDATSAENEIPKPDEEELIAPSPSACNAATCNQWCRRLKYAGGWCRFGQCQCF